MLLNRTNIPSDIATVEQLLAWAGFNLHHSNGGLQFLYAQGQALSKVCDKGHFNDGNGDRRVGLTFFMPFDSSYDFDNSKKLWMFANEISTATQASGFDDN